MMGFEGFAGNRVGKHMVGRGTRFKGGRWFGVCAPSPGRISFVLISHVCGGTRTKTGWASALVFGGIITAGWLRSGWTGRRQLFLNTIISLGE